MGHEEVEFYNYSKVLKEKLLRNLNITQIQNDGFKSLGHFQLFGRCSKSMESFRRGTETSSVAS